MISVDAKNDRKQQEIKNQQLYLFIKSTFKTWNKIKTSVYFSFNFAWYSLQFDVPDKKKGWIKKGMFT